MDFPRPRAITFLQTGKITAALLLMLALIGCDSPAPALFQGYVEGDFVYVSSENSGRLVSLLVRRGDRVVEGQKLALLDYDRQLRQLAIEDGNLKAEQARLSDLSKGQRQEELNIVSARIAQAQQEANIAASRVARYQKIRPQGYVSDFEFRQAQAESRQKKARVGELMSQLESNRLPSRPDQLLAQQARVEAAREALLQSQNELDKRSLISGVSAIVYDVILHAGEVVTPGQPVISLLPQNALKVRFFVPDGRLAGLAQGQKISLLPAGAERPVAAEIDFISPKAEYAPPVIYSKERRDRLVFMVEARPTGPAHALKPGQPVEVQL